MPEGVKLLFKSNAVEKQADRSTPFQKDHPDHFINLETVLAAQARLVDGVTASHLADTFRALADPTRLSLISALLEHQLCVYDLAALVGLSQSAVSHQLRNLRYLRLVRANKTGRTVYYALDDDHIRELFLLGLEHVQHGG